MGTPHSPVRTPHKHAELIKAWADGAEIQIKITGFGSSTWVDANPAWNPDFDYRIKPKTIKYRQYLVRYDGGNIGVNTVMDWEGYQPQMHYRFLKWLGDWQEIEVE